MGTTPNGSHKLHTKSHHLTITPSQPHFSPPHHLTISTSFLTITPSHHQISPPHHLTISTQ
ncbi:MAG: hypothetical protein SPD86_08005 [Prevotella sp.]|nr:hypothetical protein [Prevotella sp.]MDY5469864.1 hypothetical protein [Prevotella sp.]